MTRRLLLLCLTAAAFTMQPVQQVAAQPTALRDDIQVRNMLRLNRGIFRIVKDRRDNTLYTLAGNGSISRIERGENAVGETIAQGKANPNTGERNWTILNSAEGLPAEVPIEAIRAAAEALSLRANDPTDGDQLHILSTQNGNIVKPPNLVVATPQEHGLDFPKAIFFGADGTLYVVLDLEKANAPNAVAVASSADHGFTDVQGFDIGPDGTFYIGATTRDNGRVNNIVKGVFDPSTGQRTWTTIAITEPLPSGTKNHPHPGIVVSPDGRFVYLNSGSRTDHGEAAPAGGYPEGTREVPLSSAILRVPSDGEGIVIPADEEALKASGYFFADGFRNAFDMAFAGNGDLFAGDNGPDSDLPDALMWVRQGHHFGFPWRMGGIDNPQTFPDYDPTVDNYILFTASGAKSAGLFHNDPTFPPPPMVFSDPVVNLGPDADRFRDPETGEARDASDLGLAVKTFTPHSSPLGIVFDVDNALSPEFRGDGFVLRTGDDCCSNLNSFDDPDQDLLHLDLEKVGDNYQARVTRIVEGFRGPMDTAIINNKIYVVERSGPRGLWEITLPAGPVTAVEETGDGAVPANSALAQNYPNPFNPGTVIPFQINLGDRVELVVYDLAGQKIRTLVNGQLAAGSYTADWDGRDQSGVVVASGVYLYQLHAGTHRETRKLTLLR